MTQKPVQEPTAGVAALDRYFGITDSLRGNGCEHGFKPASVCPDAGCAARLAAEAWDALVAPARAGDVATDADAARWRHHLDALLRRPGETMVLGGASREGNLSLQVGAGDPRALLWIARRLIEQAQERGGGACCQAALDVLPDPLVDDDEG